MNMRKVNFSAYAFNAKIQVLKSMEFKFDYFLSLVMEGIAIVFRVFIWMSVFRGFNTVENINFYQMVIYSIMANFLSVIFCIDIESNINESVKSGNISYLLTKPINLIFFWLSSDLGNTLHEIICYIIPFSLLAILVAIGSIPLSVISIILFVISVTLSYLILWEISFCVGSIAIWTAELGSISRIRKSIIFILSGSFVPICFFPKSIRIISKYLPFEHIYQTPLGILIKKQEIFSSLELLGIQAIWVISLVLISSVIWVRAQKKIVVQGG